MHSINIKQVLGQADRQAWRYGAPYGYNLTRRKLRFLSEAHGSPVGEKMEIRSNFQLFSTVSNYLFLKPNTCIFSPVENTLMVENACSQGSNWRGGGGGWGF